MSVMDKFLNYMKLNDEDDEMEGYIDGDYLDDDDEPAPAPVPQFTKRKNMQREYEEPVVEEKPVASKKTQPVVSSKVTPMRQPSSRRTQGGNGMEVCVIRPTSIEDAREITETLLANRTVVLNLEGLDTDIAQRIIDFIAGSSFAIGGNLQPISNYIFIITPASVDVSGDLQSLLGGGAFDSPLNTDL